MSCVGGGAAGAIGTIGGRFAHAAMVTANTRTNSASRMQDRSAGDCDRMHVSVALDTVLPTLDELGVTRWHRSRARAQPSETGSSVVSNLRGRFVMRGAKIDFTELTFQVPGAEVQLAGLYDLHSEVPDFRGELLVEATLADMTSGFKSFLARLAQPFFPRPGGGSRFPIRILGPRSKPEFGLDMGRVFRRG
jgi:hypothetical protein